MVWVETQHPKYHELDVSWQIDGVTVPGTNNSRNLDLAELDVEAGDVVSVTVRDSTEFVRDPAFKDGPRQSLTAGSHELSATVTDPADPSGESETRTWTVDNELPTAPRTLSEPLTTLSGDTEHNVYFGEFTMGLEPQDDEEGFVVGEFRLNQDGWFNYFGFPDEPFGTPFKFSHSGTVVKALIYGNLGTGGMSKAAFEQSFPDFEPGYGTHTVEHRAIDASGNIGNADDFKATVLPGEFPDCTTTLSGKQKKVVIWSGVTCLEDANVVGGVRVRPGASLVASNSSIKGGLESKGADVVQLFGGNVNGTAKISETTGDVTFAGTTFNGSLTLLDNEVGDYGVVIAGNTIKGLVQRTTEGYEEGAQLVFRRERERQCRRGGLLGALQGKRRYARFITSGNAAMQTLRRGHGQDRGPKQTERWYLSAGG